MTQLTENFARSEFACKCECGFDTVDIATAQLVQGMRDVIGSPIIVNSGCRCPSHNEAVDGEPDSQHLYGRAADIRAPGVEMKVLAEIAENLRATGVGLYDGWVHVDTRTGPKVFWDRRKAP